MKLKLFLAAACAVLCAVNFVQAQDAPQAYVGAHLIPVSGAEIDNGVIIVRAGKIVDVGAADAVNIPADAQRIDVAGKVIMPGLVDTHSHIGCGPRAATAGADPAGRPHPRRHQRPRYRAFEKRSQAGSPSATSCPARGTCSAGRRFTSSIATPRPSTTW